MDIKKCMLIFVCFFIGCTSMKIWVSSYTFDEVIAQKNAIDAAQNPAEGYMLLKELEKKRVIIKKAVVKEVVPSTNIDYNFCVVATVDHPSGSIECHIHTRNWRNEEDIDSIAKLKPGDTIHVVGVFKRFLKLLGQQYVVEIVEANISKVKQ